MIRCNIFDLKISFFDSKGSLIPRTYSITKIWPSMFWSYRTPHTHGKNFMFLKTNSQALLSFFLFFLFSWINDMSFHLLPYWCCKKPIIDLVHETFKIVETTLKLLDFIQNCLKMTIWYHKTKLWIIFTIIYRWPYEGFQKIFHY